MSFLNKINSADADNAKADGADRYLVYRRHAGIGDLLVGLYYAWKYANATGRKLVIDWRWSTYVNTSSNLFSYLFKDCYIRGTALIGAGLDDMEFPAPFYPEYYDNSTIQEKPFESNGKIYGCQRELEIEMRKICCECPRAEKTIVTNEEVRLFPYTKPIPEDAKNFINIIWSSLVVHVDTYAKNTFKELFGEKTNITGFHIRLGNNDKTFNKAFLKRIDGYNGKNVREYIKKYIIPIAESLPDDNRIYVATDTEEAKNQALDLIPNCIIYDKWFAPPGLESHFSARDRNAPNGLEILRDSLTEIYLLSQCENIYSTFRHSAFAKIAGLLGKQTSVHFI